MRREAESIHRELRLSLLAPDDDDEAASVELYRMFAGFPARGEQAEVSVALRLEAYFTAVGKVPTWALRQAVDDVLAGEAGLDPGWAPTPPQLAELARRHLGPVRDAVATVGHLLAADVELPEPDEAALAKRDEMVAKWKKLSAGIKRTA